MLRAKFSSGKEVNFHSIASTGTQSLALYYYWITKITKKDEVSLVFIDDFAAFSYNKVAEMVIKFFLQCTTQVIIVTHNTSIMCNSILRPDCYFNLENGTIEPLSNLTHKELREAHNIEKMYKAGHFNISNL